MAVLHPENEGFRRNGTRTRYVESCGQDSEDPQGTVNKTDKTMIQDTKARVPTRTVTVVRKMFRTCLELLWTPFLLSFFLPERLFFPRPRAYRYVYLGEKKGLLRCSFVSRKGWIPPRKKERNMAAGGDRGRRRRRRRLLMTL